MLLTIHPSLQSVLYCAFIGTVISDIAAVCTLYPSLHTDAQGPAAWAAAMEVGLIVLWESDRSRGSVC